MKERGVTLPLTVTVTDDDGGEGSSAMVASQEAGKVHARYHGRKKLMFVGLGNEQLCQSRNVV